MGTFDPSVRQQSYIVQQDERLEWVVVSSSQQDQFDRQRAFIASVFHYVVRSRVSVARTCCKCVGEVWRVYDNDIVFCMIQRLL